VILACQDYKPREFATQINLNPKNMWATLKHFILLLRKQPDGKYVILRDTEKNAVLVYSVPEESSQEKKGKDEETTTSS